MDIAAIQKNSKTGSDRGPDMAGKRREASYVASNPNPEQNKNSLVQRLKAGHSGPSGQSELSSTLPDQEENEECHSKVQHKCHKVHALTFKHTGHWRKLKG